MESMISGYEIARGENQRGLRDPSSELTVMLSADELLGRGLPLFDDAILGGLLSVNDTRVDAAAHV